MAFEPGVTSTDRCHGARREDRGRRGKGAIIALGGDNLEQKEAGILAVPEEKAGGAEELEEAGGKALVVKEVKEESAKRLSIIFVDETLNLSEEDLASVKECWTRLDLAESKNPPQAPTPPPSTPDGEPEVDPLFLSDLESPAVCLRVVQGLTEEMQAINDADGDGDAGGKGGKGGKEAKGDKDRKGADGSSRRGRGSLPKGMIKLENKVAAAMMQCEGHESKLQRMKAEATKPSTLPQNPPYQSLRSDLASAKATLSEARAAWIEAIMLVVHERSQASLRGRREADGG